MYRYIFPLILGFLYKYEHFRYHGFDQAFDQINYLKKNIKIIKIVKIIEKNQFNKSAPIRRSTCLTPFSEQVH